MNRNVLIVMAGGFLIAILVALLIQATISGGKKEAQVTKEEPRVEIIVATEDLKAGSDLSKDNIRWQSWPKSGVFAGAVIRKGDKKPLEMLSGTLRRPVASGEPIPKGAVISESEVMLSAMLSPGKRAVTINVKAASMVGGFTRPGDYVDILLNYKQTFEVAKSPAKVAIEGEISKHIDEMAIETIMENIKVLAVDQRHKPSEKAAQIGKTVTLEVDRKQAEILTMAASVGSLTLTLRRLGDDKVVGQQYPIVTDARITNVDKEIREKLLQMSLMNENNASQTTNYVRIYSSGSVSTVPVGQ